MKERTALSLNVKGRRFLRKHVFLARPVWLFLALPFWSGPFWREFHENNFFQIF